MQSINLDQFGKILATDLGGKLEKVGQEVVRDLQNLGNEPIQDTLKKTIADAESTIATQFPAAKPIIDELSAMIAGGGLNGLGGSLTDQAVAIKNIVDAICAAATVASPEAAPMVAVFRQFAFYGIDQAVKKNAGSPASTQMSQPASPTSTIPAPAPVKIASSPGEIAARLMGSAGPSSAPATSSPGSSPSAPIPPAESGNVPKQGTEHPQPSMWRRWYQDTFPQDAANQPSSKQSFILAYIFFVGYFGLIGFYFWGLFVPQGIDEDHLQAAKDVLTWLLPGTGALIAHYFARRKD